VPLVIACHQVGLLGDNLQHQNVWYQIEQDGCLNPQPTPDDFERMRHFASTFCARDVSEARASQLEWPDEWATPDPEPDPAPEAAPTPEPEAAEEEDDTGSMSWNELRRYAAGRGLETSGKKKDELLAELAELDDE
jgi:hypothetical protein